MNSSEFKDINIKSPTCYYFDDLIKIKILISIIFQQMKNYTKMFWLMTFHAKLCLVQSHSVLDLLKQMNLLEIMMKLEIQYYLALKNMTLFKKNQISFKSKKWYYICFFHSYTIIKIYSYDSLTLGKTLTLHNVIILIKSAFNARKNHYYYNVHINNITMTYYDKSDVSEGIDVNKTN